MYENENINAEGAADVTSWVKITATAKREYMDDLSAVMSMISSQLMIEDYADVEQTLDGVYGDLIDEKLLRADKTVVSVSVFIASSYNPAESTQYLTARFAELGIPAELTTESVSEEDWADSWKQYYKPIKTGERIVIVPVWEHYDAKPGELIVLMDPGMAFGTGTHETTRLCATLLEKYVKPGCKMLDVGCGSGILAICAAKLGAAECFACDIDKTAVRIAGENAVLNATPAVKVGVSNLLAEAPKAGGGYDVVCANIVADIVMRLGPDVGGYMAPDGVLIASGIITERRDEVVSALEKCGLHLACSLVENGWFCGCFVK